MMVENMLKQAKHNAYTKYVYYEEFNKIKAEAQIVNEYENNGFHYTSVVLSDMFYCFEEMSGYVKLWNSHPFISKVMFEHLENEWESLAMEIKDNKEYLDQDDYHRLLGRKSYVSDMLIQAKYQLKHLGLL